MPKISVVMPVYNTKEDYFREAIESVLAQTFSDFELIIADDCSKDYIKEIVCSYQDKRICYYRMPENAGAAAARNFAISKAKGEFLAFMDSDDISLPTRFEEQINYFQANPEVGCLGTQITTIGSKVKMGCPKNLSHKDIENWLLFTGCAFCQSSVMLRKEILDKNNIQYNLHYVPAEDYALWLDLIGKTQFAILDKTLVTYRFYAENISNRQRGLQDLRSGEAQLNALEKYFGFELDNREFLLSFFHSRDLLPEDLEKLSAVLKQLFEGMKSKGVFTPMVLHIFQRKFKKLYHHTHTLKGQWRLLTSPLNKVLKLPLSMRLMCFITRGIL